LFAYLQNWWWLDIAPEDIDFTCLSALFLALSESGATLFAALRNRPETAALTEPAKPCNSSVIFLFFTTGLVRGLLNSLL
jgi:hypothetical protein